VGQDASHARPVPTGHGRGPAAGRNKTPEMGVASRDFLRADVTASPPRNPCPVRGTSTTTPRFVPGRRHRWCVLTGNSNAVIGHRIRCSAPPSIVVSRPVRRCGACARDARCLYVVLGKRSRWSLAVAGSLAAGDDGLELQTSIQKRDVRLPY
jgi:hypothetical protein